MTYQTRAAAPAVCLTIPDDRPFITSPASRLLNGLSCAALVGLASSLGYAVLLQLAY